MLLSVKGKNLMVLTPADVLDTVEQLCGEDLALYLRETFSKCEDKEQEQRMRLASDIRSYEMELESNSAAFQDILDVLDSVKPRQRQKALDSIREIINNQI